jgi:hypothetical protein
MVQQLVYRFLCRSLLVLSRLSSRLDTLLFRFLGVDDPRPPRGWGLGLLDVSLEIVDILLMRESL